jgi:hypothetical protein
VRNLANFLLFQAAWFAGVRAAGLGNPWLGPATMAVVVVVHLALSGNRWRELGFLLCVGALGSLADNALASAGALIYPTSDPRWSLGLVPLWITCLWIGFATLPRLSLAWLSSRPVLAAAFGAVGGPLSYLAGVRLNAVGVGTPPVLTWGALAIEYAVVTPLLLALATKMFHDRDRRPGTAPRTNSSSSVPEQAASTGTNPASDG